MKVSATFASVMSLAGLLTLAACGGASSNSGVNAVEPEEELTLRKTYVFSRDDRPVDGLMNEMKFVEDAQGKWTVSLRTAFYDRINGKAVDETRVLSESMSCKFLQGFVPGLVKVLCERDQRPVDGVLRQIELVKTDVADEFDASERVVFVDRINGKEVEKINELASGLKRKSIIDLPPQPIYCTAIAGVMFNPATNQCVSFSNGCQQAAMVEAGYTGIPAGVTCN